MVAELVEWAPDRLEQEQEATAEEERVHVRLVELQEHQPRGTRAAEEVVGLEIQGRVVQGAMALS